MCNTDEKILRLAARKQILEIIYHRRLMECDPGIGASIERQIRARELAELKEERPASSSIALQR